MDSGLQVLDSPSSSVELGFRIPIVTGILDSLSGMPESKPQDSGFHNKKVPDSGLPYIGQLIYYTDERHLSN